jgi:hypothetical protein
VYYVKGSQNAETKRKIENIFEVKTFTLKYLNKNNKLIKLYVMKTYGGVDI